MYSAMESNSDNASNNEQTELELLRTRGRLNRNNRDFCVGPVRLGFTAVTPSGARFVPKLPHQTIDFETVPFATTSCRYPKCLAETVGNGTIHPNPSLPSMLCNPFGIFTGESQTAASVPGIGSSIDGRDAGSVPTTTTI
jgi:hypothetical protein